MKTYQYHSRKLNSDIQITFNKQGNLKELNILSEIEPEPEAFLKVFVNEPTFLAEAKLHQLKVIEIKRVVEFDEFWEKYKQKDCGKTKALESWNKLSRVDQLEAVDYIPIFFSKLKANNTIKPYATTYLNQKRWQI
jgi:hypothetical protein